MSRFLNAGYAGLAAYVPGEHFFCDGGHENTLRLNFSMQEADVIRAGMERLGRAIKR